MRITPVESFAATLSQVSQQSSSQTQTLNNFALSWAPATAAVASWARATAATAAKSVRRLIRLVVFLR